MKLYFFTYIVLLFFCLFCFKISLAQTDTLSPAAVSYTSDGFIYKTDDGYVTGTNSRNDLCKAQEFVVIEDSGYYVQGALFWFGKKTIIGNDTGQIRLTMWNMDGIAGASDPNPGAIFPLSVLNFKKVSLHSIDTSSVNNMNNYHVAMFNEPIYVFQNYILGFDIGLNGDDTLVIMSSENGTGNQNKSVWQLQLNARWEPIDDNWFIPETQQPFDIELFIFPIVTYNNSNTEKIINNAELQMPNPFFVSQDWLTLNLKSTFDVSIEIISLNGQVICKNSYGKLPAGMHKLKLPLIVNNNSATVLVSVNLNSERIIKKIILQK